MGCSCTGGDRTESENGGNKKPPPQSNEHSERKTAANLPTQNEASNTQPIEAKSPSKKDVFAVELIDAVHMRKPSLPITKLYQFKDRIHSDEKYKYHNAVLNSTGQPCIIKTFNKADQSKQIKAIVNAEIEILSGFDHPSIPKIYEVIEDNKLMYIVEETVNGPTLAAYLSKKQVVSESVAANIVLQLFSTLLYCHAKDAFHGEIKPNNLVFVTETVDENAAIKLTGFRGENLSLSLRTIVQRVNVSSPYSAPEIQNGIPTVKSEVWNCGVLLLVMLCGLLPKSEAESEELTRMSRKIDYMFVDTPRSRMSLEAKNFIISLLHFNPEKRPSIADCLQAPWIQQHVTVLKPKAIVQVTTALSHKASRTMIRAAIAKFILTRVVKNEQMLALTEQFQALDLNHDGLVSLEELTIALMKIKTEKEARAQAIDIMRSVDENKNEAMDYSEFLLSSYCDKQLLSRENLLRAFNTMDRDSSGSISLKELKTLLTIKGNTDNELLWEAFLSDVDRSGDGEISFMEFKKLMLKAIDS